MTTQTRLFVSGPRMEAERAFSRLESEFEEDGFPLSIFEANEEQQIFEVSLYVEAEIETARARMDEALAATPLLLPVQAETLPDIDWVSHSLEGLKPVRVGRYLVHGRHDRELRRPADIAIEVEAGLAFGTGHHGTTAGCLDLLANVLETDKPRNALDLGTGSGVLAIAIAKTARIPILATDIDPIAVRVAQDNAKLNGVSAYIRAHTAPGFHHRVFAEYRPFDLIVANILARPLMTLATDMSRHIKAGGSLVMSGILERQRRAVIAAYTTQGFRHISTKAREGWVTLHLKR